MAHARHGRNASSIYKAHIKVLPTTFALSLSLRAAKDASSFPPRGSSSFTVLPLNKPSSSGSSSFTAFALNKLDSAGCQTPPGLVSILVLGLVNPKPYLKYGVEEEGFFQSFRICLAKEL